MKQARVTTASGTYDYWMGGQGAPLLLLHGGWAGAEAHWATIWENLARDHTVIAIELPGIWKDFEKSLPSYKVYAGVCADILSSLSLVNVAVIGNSLGASIGWQLAFDRPDLVRHLIMVNGFPPSRLPMRDMFAIRPLRSLAIGSLIRNFYSPAIFKTAFVNASSVPQAIRENLSASAQAMAGVMFRILYSVTSSSRQPLTNIDYVWGAQDDLPNLRLVDGEKLCSATPTSRIFPIPQAGHLPQVENPDAFVIAVNTILSSAQS